MDKPLDSWGQGPLRCPCSVGKQISLDTLVPEFHSDVGAFAKGNSLCPPAMMRVMAVEIGSLLALSGLPPDMMDEYLLAVFRHVVVGFNAVSSTYTVSLSSLEIETKETK